MAGRVPPSRGVVPHVGVALLLLLAVGSASSRRPEPYYGRLVGKLNQYAHGIRGTVYAVDESTVFIRGFAYDGTGPDAYFWVGDTPQPTPEGILVPYPEDYDSNKDPPILSAHSNSDILLRLPGGKRLRDIKWLSVWCRRFTVNFGDVFIPAGLDPPRPRVLPEFKRLAHGLRSGNISVLDAKTFYIPNLHYDGAGPDAYFWVGNGSEPNPFGTKVPNEVGSLNPLRGYQGEDIEIQLPGKLTAYDIDWLAVWCVEYRHNFGHVYIPKDLDVPPALGQTKITPPWWYNPTSSTTSQTPHTSTSNCKEILDKRLQVRWEVQGDQVQITLAARLRKDQYMSFGISGAEGRPAMLGADVVVAYWDSKGNQPKVADYTITHLAQCDGERGVCPDHKLGGSNDAVVVSGNQKNGITTITYRRPLAAKESSKDKEILTSRSQSVIAAFGPLNSKFEANAHSFMDTTRHDVQLDFGATNDNTCIGLAELDESGPQPWTPRVISGVTNFTARIGPAGGNRGYTPITGHPSWGIAWYINDQLIPELYVERGKTYTFFVEGGDDRTNPAKYHPFYISDSSEGGFGQKKEEDQRKQRVFAGVAYDNEGYPYPTAVGRYCEWSHKTVDQWAKSETFEEYMQTLQLECHSGEPAALNWTVAHETPDLVYYQVPNEVGSLNPLRGYQGEDIEIQLPGKLTAYDIDWLAVWCVEYRHNFGHVYIPKDLDVPPALGQTKITPPWWYNPTSSTTSQTPHTSTSNCKEILDKRLQVRWEVQGDQVQITLAARLRKDQYMSFGISGAEGRPAMLGADVVVAYWDSKGNQPKVADYTITHLAQCDGERGVCPDHKLGGSNDAVVVSGNQKNGITTITYRRPLAAKESSKDKEILTSRSQSVIAAFGPLNSKFEANAHSFMDTTRHDVQLDFGATNDNTCIGLAELDESGPQPWTPRVISGVTNFTARIGPAGGNRGYTPITGHPSWGIAWYINDQLIPELYVERGKTYTFFVEGGDDRTNPAKYHPFYISDSSEGGFGQKKEEDQRKQRVFAGVAYDNEGYPYPTAVGRYCEWSHKTVDQWAKSETFEEYMQTLQLECHSGEPAALNWTVAHETPDLVYYQCYTHNNLGWKIHVVDPGTPIPLPGDQKARMNSATIFLPLSALSPLVIMTAMRNMAR